MAAAHDLVSISKQLPNCRDLRLSNLMLSIQELWCNSSSPKRERERESPLFMKQRRNHSRYKLMKLLLPELCKPWALNTHAKVTSRRKQRSNWLCTKRRSMTTSMKCHNNPHSHKKEISQQRLIKFYLLYNLRQVH